MASNDKPSTSRDFKSESDVGEEHDENLSTEQICKKIKTFRNLCLGDKVNVNNAFEIDMIGYFHSWFEKKKGSIFDSDNDVTSLQELSDYLEASAKVYSYNIDNLAESTSRLVEQFKSMNYKKRTTPEDNDNAPKIQKRKRRGTMLTTNKKLKRKLDGNETTFNPDLIDHNISSLLKSYTPAERKEIEENFDECTQQNIKQSNTNKKRNQVKINWLNKNQINEILKNSSKSKEKLSHRTLQKWNKPNRLADTQTINDDIKYKFDFLQYMEIKPDWWIHENRKKGICAEASNSSQNINDCGESIVESSDSMEIKDEDPEQLTKENDDGTDDKLNESRELNSDDEDVMGDIKSVSRMDIVELKKEISDIIDEECVETDPKSEWSSKLSFCNLLLKLRVYEREGLSISFVFIGLLHLASERGLKLIQEHCIINDFEETFIIKPMK